MNLDMHTQKETEERGIVKETLNTKKCTFRYCNINNKSKERGK